MKDLFTKYDSLFLKDDIKQKVTALANNSHQYLTTDNLKLLFSLIDLTSLNTEDNETKIKSMI